MTCQTNLATNIKDNKTAEDEKICSGSPNDFGQPIKTWGEMFLKLFWMKCKVKKQIFNYSNSFKQ